jgi:hypothetical protein
MVNFHDKRAEKEAREAAAAAAGENGGVDIREDGSLRRPGKGGRSLAHFFAAENHQRPITRGEYINLRSSEEYARRESRWFVRIWRFLLGEPRVTDTPRRFAEAHARSLVALQAEMERSLQERAIAVAQAGLEARRRSGAP